MQGKGIGVIYLFRDKFQIYTTLLPGILEFRFIDTIVRDLEIVNKELLESILKIFIESNAILPCSLVIVPADSVCFIKDFALNTPANNPPAGQNHDPKAELSKINEATSLMHKQQDEFIEGVPFELVGVQIVPMGNGERVYAANQELMDTIKLIFERHGFPIDSVIPGALFGQNLGLQQTLTPATGQVILQALPALKKFNMHTHIARDQEVSGNEEQKEIAKVEQEIIEPEISGKKKAKTDKKRLILLGGVFAFLIIVLIIVYITSNQPASNTPPNQPVSSVEFVNP